MSSDPLIARAKAVLDTERAAIEAAIDRSAEQVVAAARLILEREPADVILTGVGKSGHIAHKLAATLSSVGTRSHFYWTSEMFHGDLGSVDRAGAVVLISKSGSGSDLAQLADFANRRGIALIGIIGDRHSPLVSKLDVFIDASVHQEADPEGFVPTTSTTLALALGDALAVCLMEARGFTSADFAQFHPNGALGADSTAPSPKSWPDPTTSRSCARPERAGFGDRNEQTPHGSRRCLGRLRSPRGCGQRWRPPASSH